jgi:glycosyltransferase involved in cell wall biosynthesis
MTSARYRPHRGGLESVVYHVSEELQRQGHCVCIVANRFPRALPAHEIINWIPVTRMHFLQPDWTFFGQSCFDLFLAGIFFLHWTAYCLKKLIREFQPDVIISHYLSDHAEFVGRYLLKNSASIRWVISLHGGDVDRESFPEKTNGERFNRLSRQANGLTAYSGDLAVQAQVLEPSLKREIEVIHNGVDAGRFANAKPYLNDCPYILAVGQLVSHKGFDLLIKAFAQVTEKYPRVRLWIAGEGVQRNELEMLISQNQLVDRVQLFGKVDEAMVESLMAGCLFIAMPSRREPFGIVALEGMAAGKLVLTASVGGLLEFIPSPPNRFIRLDVFAWAQALDEWLVLAMSGQLKSDVNVYEARKRDWSLVASHYLQVYEQVLHHV